jgi:predicted MFS family arabinose efflux permease
MVSNSVDSADPNTRMMDGILTLIPLGIGEIIGSMSIGRVIDTYGSKRASSLILCSIALQTIFTLWFISSGVYGILAFLMTFSWGLQDALVNTHLTEILGFEF